MAYGPNFAIGLQRLQDARMRYLRTSCPTWIRYKNFGDVRNQQWAQLGFQITPNPADAPVGTTDVFIDPWPCHNTMSLHNIGMSGGKLRFGAVQFFISATFITQQAALLGLPDPYQVWEQVLGLVSENVLFSIEDIQHEDVSGQILNWIIVCNRNELR
jgi:hypothetical protein